MRKTQYVDAALLDMYEKKSGLRLGHIVDQLGISRQAYDKKKRGDVSFRAAEVFVLCSLFNIPDEDKDKIFCF